MSNYTFYFDESMHDKKIGLSDDANFNFLKESSHDVYVGAFWGVRSKKLSEVKVRLTNFENFQKRRYGLLDNQELKTTTIDKKCFTYGFRTFNADCYSFYDELFDLIHEIKPVIHITMISKMEIFLRHIFNDLNLDFCIVIPEFFYYSITKFMIVYGTESLRNKLFNVRTLEEMNDFVDSIIAELQEIIEKTKSIQRKCSEYVAFRQLILVLSSYTESNKIPNKKYPFEYDHSFNGLCRLLKEKRINICTTEVFIDEENNTLKAAQNFDFERTDILKSHQSVEIRLSDWIAGFVGRMIVALNKDKGILEHYESLSDMDNKDISSKHLLSSDWFDISEQVFVLYKKAFQVFVLDRENEYWASMTGAFFDSTSLFYSFLRYFGNFADYKTYKEIQSDKHRELFNSLSCADLMKQYYKNKALHNAFG